METPCLQYNIFKKSKYIYLGYRSESWPHQPQNHSDFRKAVTFKLAYDLREEGYGDVCIPQHTASQRLTREGVYPRFGPLSVPELSSPKALPSQVLSNSLSIGFS